jgi:hypothetical protein
VQKNNRELEMIIQEAILVSIRDSIPTEAIIRAYMDESEEHEEEVIIENIEEPHATEEPVAPAPDAEVASEAPPADEVPEVVPSIQNIDEEPTITKLAFNDYDSVMAEDNNVSEVNAPKTIERLEDISTTRALERKLDEEADSDDERIHIHTDMVDLSGFDVLDEPRKPANTEDAVLDGIEELPAF